MKTCCHSLPTPLVRKREPLPEPSQALFRYLPLSNLSRTFSDRTAHRRPLMAVLYRQIDRHIDGAAVKIGPRWSVGSPRPSSRRNQLVGPRRRSFSDIDPPPFRHLISAASLPTSYDHLDFRGKLANSLRSFNIRLKKGGGSAQQGGGSAVEALGAPFP